MSTDAKFPCRFSYLTIFEPRAVEEGQEPKYSASLIIPKDDTATIKKVAKAILEVAESDKGTNDLGADNVKKIKQILTELVKGDDSNLGKGKFKLPIKDGDIEREGDDAYAGCYYINANSKRKPGIVNKYLQEVDDPEEFYSGCYGFAHINFFSYNKGVNRGIGAGLQNVMKKEDGEPLGGTVEKPQDAFADFADDPELDFGADSDDDFDPLA